jgi:hypothetical protein
MISLSTAGEDLLLSQVFQKASTWPDVAYLALFTTLPDKDGPSGVECVGTDYQRIAVDFDATTWSGPSGGQVVNASDINFGTPGAADWGIIVGFCFMMALSGTDQLSAGIPLSVAKEPAVGTPVVFAASTLVISAVESA